MKPANRLVRSEETVYEYEICGLKLISNVPFVLPKAPVSDNRSADLRFTLKSSAIATEEIFPARLLLGTIKNGAGQPSITVYRADRLFLLDCHNTQKKVRFVMSRDDGWIDCYPQGGATNYDIEVWLFGLVLAFFLQNRGIFSLHAAAVNCQGRAIAFLGNNGYGKSTLAYFFLHKGHSLITDDILPLVERDGSLVAMPVCPAMNLSSQTLALIRERQPSTSNNQIQITKRRYALKDLRLRFSKSEIPLGAIYFLRPINGNGTNSVKISPIPKVQSLIELLSNTRANTMIEVSNQMNLLKTYTSLVSKVPICQLEYSRGFDLLPAVYDEILNHNFRQDADLSGIAPIVGQRQATKLRTDRAVRTS